MSGSDRLGPSRRRPAYAACAAAVARSASRLFGQAPLLGTDPYGRHARGRRGRSPGDEAVTPVIGSIMILGITVMGIAAVMLWGGPALQRVQEQGAQGAMLGEFQEIRRDTLVLSITDSSRVPRVNLEAGTFGLRDGTRMQLTAMYHGAATACDFHVRSWGVGVNDDVVEFSTSNCGGGLTFNVYRVTGTNMVLQPSSVAVTGGVQTVVVNGVDFTGGDWMFELDDAGDAVAQAWLMSSLAVYWELIGASAVSLQLEGGAIFSGRDGTFFLEADPPIDEEAAGNAADFVIEWHTYSGSAETFTGRSTPSLFLGLVGNNLRLSQDEVFRLRFDFEGEYAQAWCNTLLQRNGPSLTGAYAQDGAFPCDGPQARKSLSYATSAQPISASAECVSNGGCFQFEFIHARITTSL